MSAYIPTNVRRRYEPPQWHRSDLHAKMCAAPTQTSDARRSMNTYTDHLSRQVYPCLRCNSSGTASYPLTRATAPSPPLRKRTPTRERPSSNLSAPTFARHELIATFLPRPTSRFEKVHTDVRNIRTQYQHGNEEATYPAPGITNAECSITGVALRYAHVGTRAFPNQLLHTWRQVASTGGPE